MTQRVARTSDFVLRSCLYLFTASLLHELRREDEAEAAFEEAVRVARDPRPYRARLLAYRQLRRAGNPR